MGGASIREKKISKGQQSITTRPCNSMQEGEKESISKDQQAYHSVEAEIKKEIKKGEKTIYF